MIGYGAALVTRGFSEETKPLGSRCCTQHGLGRPGALEASSAVLHRMDWLQAARCPLHGVSCTVSAACADVSRLQQVALHRIHRTFQLLELVIRVHVAFI